MLRIAVVKTAAIFLHWVSSNSRLTLNQRVCGALKGLYNRTQRYIPMLSQP